MLSSEDAVKELKPQEVSDVVVESVVPHVELVLPREVVCIYEVAIRADMCQ